MFSMFLGSIEMEHGHEMVQDKQNYTFEVIQIFTAQESSLP